MRFRSLSHNLIDAIDSGQFIISGMNKQSFAEVADESISAIKLTIPKAQKFFVGDDLVTFVNDQELHLVAWDMMRDGVLRFPFDEQVFELEVIDDGKLSYAVVVVAQRDDLIRLQSFGWHNGTWVWHCGGAEIVPSMSKPMAMAARLACHPSITDADHEYFKTMFTYLGQWLVGVLVALKCDVVDENLRAAPRSLNKSREMKGKSPLFEHKILTLKPGVSVRDVAPAGGTHSSPRLHWRRGHVRRVGADRVTWIKPHLVGNSHLGVVTKDYEMHAPSKTAGA